jgi:glycosyltransferase involved in cell wall biosynthesis
MSKPFFSIAIPTYEFKGKGVLYLENNFKILESQTFKDFEIIISDDSENDNIKNLCFLWSNKLNITHYFNPNKSKRSHSININNALNKCTGEWIKILFQDDFLFGPNSLKSLFDFINENKQIYWFFTKFFHSVDGINYYNLYTPKWNSNVWLGDNTLGGPSGLTIKNKKLPKFDENLIWLMDCDFYQQVFLNNGEPKICDKITVVNRTSLDQLTTLISEDVKIKEHKIIITKYDSIT